ncbi:leucine-rich repeat domain-containing protein [Acidisoma sp. C75]
MAAFDDDLAEARARIAEEAERRTGTLDLRDLKLESLPDEVFGLRHLRVLGFGTADTHLDGVRLNRINFCRHRLSELSDLEGLFIPWTDLKSLDFARALQHLHALDCAGTAVTDLSPLSGLTALTSLDCSRTAVSDLSPLSGLTALTSLDCWNTSVSDLGLLSGLTALRSLNCADTSVDNLSPLSGLTALTYLDCLSTAVSNLSPLAGLTALTYLDCSFTSVSDLSPLSGLTALTSLNCADTSVDNLSPLSGLTALTSLSCSSTSVDDLSPLSGLTALTNLDCSFTSVSDLGSLSGLMVLTNLDCSFTSVSDLGPLSGLTVLRSLSCSSTAVSDLSPLSSLTALTSLKCSHTAVSDLSPLSGLKALQRLDCSYCRLLELPEAIWSKPSLEKLYLFGSHIMGSDSNILSKSRGANCLEAVRAHYADFAAGKESITDIKLMLLGNGGAGKTQIAGWLNGAEFDPHSNSTHGIRIVQATEPGSVAARLRLQIWDFGGQDIYHGTHALFLHGPAIVMPVWAKDRENRDTYEHEGITFRNHPLAYWVDVARNQGNPLSPCLIVQSKCDHYEDEQRHLSVPPEALDALPYWKTLHVSPKTGRGRGALEDALQDAIAWLRNPERLGLPEIGAGRMRVIRALETMRQADMALPPEQRRRFLEQETFEAICTQAGGISSPSQFLAYLDASGAVFYRPGFFEDRIVLDQGWLLEAIYAVFDRKNVYRQLRAQDGRFTRYLLGCLVWQNYKEEEQELFISAMRSCGICFQQRRLDDGDAIYVAPDLLPDKQDVLIDAAIGWAEDAAGEKAEFHYALLHGGLIRSILAEIGELAGERALYWRGGLRGFEADTQSRFMVEEHLADGAWSGSIRVRTQGGRAAEALQKLMTLIERVQNRLAMRPTHIDRSSSPIVSEKDSTLSIGQEKSSMPEWYVSYGWGDKTPEGQNREAVVDEFCRAAEAKGRQILRDKNVMRQGDRISAFMRKLGAGDLIFVFMSEKYLRSANCMFELSEIWRTSQQEGDRFLQRVRLWVIDDVKVWKPVDWGRWAEHWKQEYDELDAIARRSGGAIIGETGHRQLMLMQRFYTQVADILGTLADVMQARNLGELLDQEF